MIAADLPLETYPGTDIIDLAGLHSSVIVTLGSLGCPSELEVIIGQLPPDCQRSFDNHARNVNFPGKPEARPARAFFEYHFMRFGALVEYVYDDPAGFVLSRAGQDHYAKLVVAHDPEIRILPKTEPTPDRGFHQLGADPSFALRSA